jgi:hypothetical protein
MSAPTRAQLVEAAFKLGACAESLTVFKEVRREHESAVTLTSGPVPMTRIVEMDGLRLENVRKALKEVADLLGKDK